MKTIGGLGVAVIASIALLQSAQGRPASGGRSFGGGHSFSSGHSISRSAGRSGHYYAGPRNYSGGARYSRLTPRVSNQTAARNRAYYSRSAVNRTTALNPKSYSASSPRLAAARQAALRSQGFDSKGRVQGNVTRNWDRNRDHNWNGHRCHWRNNCWVVIDPWPLWYPWGYGYYGPYSYYEPAYSENVYEPADYAQDDYGNAIGDVQSVLAQKGYYHGQIDGRMGPATRSAVRQYQRNHGLQVTGNIDQGIIDALRVR